MWPLGYVGHASQAWMLRAGVVMVGGARPAVCGRGRVWGGAPQEHPVWGWGFRGPAGRVETLPA